MVKAFNTLSAWALQNGPSDASRQVLNMSVCVMVDSVPSPCKQVLYSNKQQGLKYKWQTQVNKTGGECVSENSRSSRSG